MKEPTPTYGYGRIVTSEEYSALQDALNEIWLDEQSNRKSNSEFRGCFKEIGKRLDGGYLDVEQYILLPAPNRFRKMIDPGKTVSSWGGGDFNNDEVIARQLAEFDRPKPIGFEFDLFDTYLAWEK